MSAATVAAPPSAYPEPVSLPVAPKGDPIAARVLSAGYRGYADHLEHTAAQLQAICAELAGRWHGSGSAALDTPLRVISGNLHQLAAGYRHTADALQAYADALHHAQHHHGWSLGRIAAVGAIITVTAVAVVVTVGAAAPVGTAAALEVGEAIAGAETAATTATAAETTAVTALANTSLSTGLATLRLVALRQLGAAAANTTLDLGLHAATGHPITGTDLTLDVITGATASATIDATRTALHATETWRGLTGLSQAALDTTALTSTLTADDALHQYETTGHLDPTRLTEGALVTSLTGGANVLKVAARKADIAMPVEQPVRPVGIPAPKGIPTSQVYSDIDDLWLHEGKGGNWGHTLMKHIGRNRQWLEERLARDKTVPRASAFFDKEAAESAVNAVLHDPKNAADLALLLTKKIPRLTIDTRLNAPAGVVLERNGALHDGYVAVACFRWTNGRIVLTTSYVE